MRLFLAIELEEELKNELLQVQTILAKFVGSGLRLLPSENLHLTLKFIGELDEAFLGEAKELSSDTIENFHPFSISLDEVAAFPPRGPLRVCWVGLKASNSTLLDLAKSLNSAFEVLDIEAEKRDFQAHVSIARLSKDSDVSEKIRKILASLKVKPLSQEVKKISLFSSTLHSSGSVYELVEHFSLI